jgi:hypothetical protein
MLVARCSLHKPRLLLWRRSETAEVWCAQHRREADPYEAVAADLASRRSSIRSRSTSQYLSAESRSLSGWSQRRDSSGLSVFGPESFAARCSLRLDFARRHLPRRPRGAAPIMFFYLPCPFVFNSQPDSATAVTNRSVPSPVLTLAEMEKFHEARSIVQFFSNTSLAVSTGHRLEK